MISFKMFLEGVKSVITMDFDHNLKFENGEANLETVEKYRQLQRDYDVIVVTSRRKTSESLTEINNFLKENNLNSKEIIFTEGNPKAETVIKLGSIMHFDDDEEELKMIEDCAKQQNYMIKTFNTFNPKKWDEYVAASVNQNG